MHKQTMTSVNELKELPTSEVFTSWVIIAIAISTSRSGKKLFGFEMEFELVGCGWPIRCSGGVDKGTSRP